MYIDGTGSNYRVARDIFHPILDLGRFRDTFGFVNGRPEVTRVLFTDEESDWEGCVLVLKIRSPL